MRRSLLFTLGLQLSLLVASENVDSAELVVEFKARPEDAIEQLDQGLQEHPVPLDLIAVQYLLTDKGNELFDVKMLVTH